MFELDLMSLLCLLNNELTFKIIIGLVMSNSSVHQMSIKK